LGWIFILFMITIYVPDPIKLVDEIILGGILLTRAPQLLVLATIIAAILYFFFGVVPTGAFQ
jgi:hypothetical protein